MFPEEAVKRESCRTPDGLCEKLEAILFQFNSTLCKIKSCSVEMRNMMLSHKVRYRWHLSPTSCTKTTCHQLLFTLSFFSSKQANITAGEIAIQTMDRSHLTSVTKLTKSLKRSHLCRNKSIDQTGCSVCQLLFRTFHRKYLCSGLQ